MTNYKNVLERRLLNFINYYKLATHSNTNQIAKASANAGILDEKGTNGKRHGNDRMIA